MASPASRAFEGPSGEREESSPLSTTDREVLVFSPSPRQRSKFTFDSIPTYLFRLYAPCTAGTTTTTEVISPAWGQVGNHKKDLFRLPPEEAASRLYDHLRWVVRHEDRCNLMSWSSSLLFVLQYGLYRYRTDHDKPSLSEIHLLMLDTRQFPEGTFLRDLEAIDEFQKHSADLAGIKTWRMSDKYFGEYLTQGRLNVDGQCSQTSMQQLIDMGLFTLCPALGITGEWTRWAIPVVNIRNDFDGPAISIDRKNVRSAITMAQAYLGDRLALPFAVMLLSLQHRQHDDETILGGFRAMFTDDEFEALDLGGMKFDVESGRLAELNQYREMMLAINRHVRGTEVVEALYSIRKLTIGHYVGFADE
ncbi:uncharacterized protein MKZ38_004378 [Zalerion maritima]|uniref:DUF7587 domain-containing protein n=1 Tax=Zalerion maritima TaxID=339359 RepID=A0AAD5WPX0_9PEZI|nr:uncharacterized protein MKZ38_004378 [Zalerion maritima]